MKTAMNWTWELVTPQKAEKWLEVNVAHNRPVTQMWVESLALSMKDGTYIPTHEGIAFDTNGELCDGQHRLWAIVESDVPVHLWVCRNVPAESFKAINIGRKRDAHIVLNVARSDTDYASALLRNFCHRKYGTPEYKEKAIAALRPYITLIESEVGGQAKRRGVTASIRLMALLRMASASKETDMLYVRQQLIALMGNRREEMSPPIAAFSDAIVASLLGSKRTDPMTLMLRSWSSFDPARRHISRAFSRTPDLAFAEIKKAITKMWPAAPLSQIKNEEAMLTRIADANRARQSYRRPLSEGR